ncbi:AAA family ATPase [Rossellomorea sp. LJF3]|uniref:AAA family ATPase n=1 Tax=Rossellomorea sp. LJF3 TaxID=3126099 RepID=UPI00300D3932
MSLQLRDVGLISYADIEFNGLTIIAGENDTGKSTVGKTMFSIIKAFSRYEQDFNEDKKRTIFNTLDNIFFKLRRLSDNEILDIRDEFYPPKLMKELELHLDLMNVEAIENTLNYRIYLIEKSNLNESDKNLIINRIEELKSKMVGLSEKKDYIKRALKLAFMSEFGQEVSNKFSNQKAVVKYNEGLDSILEVTIEQNNLKDLTYNNLLYFNDVTYIETPLVLQMYDLISRSSAFLEDEEISPGSIRRVRGIARPTVPFHMKDIINKMANSLYYNELDETDDNIKQLVNSINNIINGEVSFDKKKRDFLYRKKFGEKYVNVKSTNVATGVKAFSILQLLLKADILNERSLLIIDEPEIHLHPKWQVEYCKIIVEIVERGIPVLVTSHSPYILQALKVFSSKSDVKSKTNFYFAEREPEGTGSVVYNVNNDLNKVFKKLSDPLQNLVWE